MAIINKKCKADPEDICLLAVKLGISNAAAAVLLNRGINSEEIGRQFLDCGDSVIHDPFEMLGMYEAVDLINEAVEDGRQITIYGDYDVDGITSTTILFRYLRSIGANVNCYIPNRFTEGYGINQAAISKIYSKGTSLIIALDCGITSVNEIALAKELGMDVMIADHHNPPEELPDADVIIDPKQKFCEYPFKELCSAGLALKIVEAHGGKDAAKKFYELAAIGTIADVVSLTDENRYYVKAGIERINKEPSPGVNALRTAAGYRDKPLTARGVAFGLAPRLNAAGRMASAKEGLQLFIQDDFRKAYEIALKLNEYNDERRKVEKEICESSVAQLNASDICFKNILVVVGEGWSKGVIGIAASRFVEDYNRPVIVITCDDEICTASARSIPGFDIYQALVTCKDLFVKFGGHSGAAGFSLSRQNIPEFTERIEKYADEHITEEMLVPTIDCEARLSPADIDMKTAKEIEKLEPFGKDNEAPLFFAERLDFNGAAVIGKEKNVLRTAINAGGMTIDCVGFGKADYIDTANCRASKSAVFSVDINQWQGIEKVQLGLKEMRLSVFNENDIDAVNEAMNQRLFEAFAESFFSTKDMAEETITAEAAFEEVCAHKMGSLVIINDKASLEKLLTKIVENSFQDYIDIFIGTLPTGHEFGANTVLAMPYKDCIRPGEFRRIYVPTTFNPEKLQEIDHIFTYSAGNPLEGEDKLDRDRFAAIYKALKENAFRFAAWDKTCSIIDTIDSSSHMKLTPFSLKLTLSVFDQLGFIRYEEADGMIRMAFSDTIRKTPLTQSSVYNKYISETAQ